MSNISRRSFLKGAGLLAVVAIATPMTLLEIFEEHAPEDIGQSSSMWVRRCPRHKNSRLGTATIWVVGTRN